MDSVAGSKSGAGVWQWLISQMPVHRVYVEAFAGSGAVLERVSPAVVRVAIDRDLETLVCFRYRWPAGTHVVCGDAISLLESMRLGADALVYADPPYPITSRRQQRRLYRWELSDEDHVRLCRCLRGLKCMVMVSTYANPIYARALGDWRLSSCSTVTRGGNRSTELLYCNFPVPSEFHDARFVGRDYRERERIKRKARRWVSMLAAMPIAERAAVLGAIDADVRPPPF